MTATLVPVTESRSSGATPPGERDPHLRRADCAEHGRLRDRLCERCGDSICQACLGSRVDGICRRCTSRRPRFEAAPSGWFANALRGAACAAVLGPIHGVLLDQLVRTDVSLLVAAAVPIGVLSGLAGLVLAPALFRLGSIAGRLGRARFGPPQLAGVGLIGALAGLAGSAIIAGVFGLGRYDSEGLLTLIYLLFAAIQLTATLILARGTARSIAADHDVNGEALAAGMSRTVALGAVVGALTAPLLILGYSGASGQVPAAGDLAVSFPVGAITGMVIAATLPTIWFTPDEPA